VPRWQWRFGKFEKVRFFSQRKLLCYRCYERQRTERVLRGGYSDKEILEAINMSVTPRCKYAGPHAQLIPTRSFAFLAARLRGLAFGWLRR
jgi:hypothetical protein